ncbi:hypothetical protein VHEMI03597 [[Torrubiella] hemipterigena]|uniref:Uncharacterized protein n=1 Tax=[Torrubiella] hemipterigena TaxID=1531966 RepID=A0A0A1ST07_9HYPO|nr:hypothetical protein VHEMI03597 [[Torrubiella] hemipterigena]
MPRKVPVKEFSRQCTIYMTVGLDDSGLQARYLRKRREKTGQVSAVSSRYSPAVPKVQVYKAVFTRDALPETYWQRQKCGATHWAQGTDNTGLLRVMQSAPGTKYWSSPPTNGAKRDWRRYTLARLQ